MSAPRRAGTGRWDPIPEASLGKLAELVRETPLCPILELTRIPEYPEERKRERKEVILLPVLKRNPWERERRRRFRKVELKIPEEVRFSRRVGSREALGEGARTASSDPLRDIAAGLSYGSNSPPALSHLSQFKGGTGQTAPPPTPALCARTPGSLLLGKAALPPPG